MEHIGFHSMVSICLYIFSRLDIEPEIARIGVLAFLDRLQEMADCSEGELKEDVCELIEEVKEIEAL